GHAGQPVAGDEVARDQVVVGRGARGGVGEQDTGAFAQEAVVGDHVVHDGVVVHARDVRLPLALAVQRGRVVTRHGDPAVGLVTGHDVVLDHVVVRRPGLIGEQHATRVVRDEVAVDLGVRNGDEVHSLAAVTGDRPGGLAFEVGRGGRDTAAQVVVHHLVVLDADVADRAVDACGEDALTQGVLHGEAAEVDVGADNHHAGEDGERAETGRVDDE